MSKYPIGFAGCFICGQLGHVKSNDCPIWRSGRGSKKTFFLELHAHKPWTRKFHRQGNTTSPATQQPGTYYGPSSSNSQY